MAALDCTVSFGCACVAAIQVEAISGLLPWSLGFSATSCALRLYEVRPDAAVELPRMLVEPILLFHLCELLVFSTLAGVMTKGASTDVRLVIVAWFSVLCVDSVVVIAALRRGTTLQRQIADLEAKAKAFEASLPPVETFSFVEDADLQGQEFESLCSICLGEFSPAEQLGRLPCRHVFHAACLDKWLRSKRFGDRAGCPFRCQQEFDPATVQSV